MKNKNLKITISILLVILLIGIVFYTKKKEQPKSQVDGTISVILVDINNNEICNKKINYYKGDNFLSLIEKNFKVVTQDDLYGKVLYEIDSIVTDFQTTYIAIYINDKYADKGISFIELENNMVVKFVEMKI